MPVIGPATYNLLVAQVRTKVTNFVTTAFGGLGSWRDEDVERFVSAVVPIVAAGQRQVATLTHTYLASQLAEGFGGSAAPLGVDLDAVTGSAVRNGAEPSDVYRRPFVDVYTALKQGQDLTTAVKRGTLRAQQLSGTDLQLAKTFTTRASLSSSKAEYFRRTLSGSENCAMCVIASTQRYRSNSLMPIHPGCDCGVQPLAGNAPHIVDPELLEAAHTAITGVTGEEDRTGRKVSDFRHLIVTHEHGEMGPILAVRKDSFTGPSAIH